MTIRWRVHTPTPGKCQHVLKGVRADFDRTYKKKIKKDASLTTQGWRSSKPSFVVKLIARGTPRGSQFDILLYLRGSASGKANWHRLDKGWRGRVIRAKRGKRLVFKEKYKPSTKRGSLRTTRARSYGKTIYARKVKHPGFKGLDWTGILIKKHGPGIQKFIHASMRKHMRKCMLKGKSR